MNTSTAPGSHEELVEMLGGEPEESGPLCELALLPEGQCGTCTLQFQISAWAARGADMVRLHDCDCGSHWSFQ